MVGGILDADELAALRAVMVDQFAPQARPVGEEATEARPIALIADDRACRLARPDALRIAGRWSAAARVRLLRALGVKLEVRVEGVEVVSGGPLRDALEGAWTRVVRVEGRGGFALLAVSGAMVEGMAAILLGGTPDGDEPESDRPPSRTALGVFSRAGELIASSLSEAWREEQSSEVSAVTDTSTVETWKQTLYAAESLIAVTLALSGSTSGRIRLVAAPELFIAAPPRSQSKGVTEAILEDVLSMVPIEVRVELGVAEISMGALSALMVGDVITLNRSTDDPLPVFCADVKKAWGRPVVTRGVLGVEIVDHQPEEEK
ncbi:MAG: FliM/FliN family flagellar motor switch protein [Myxococcota bacterium]